MVIPKITNIENLNIPEKYKQKIENSFMHWLDDSEEKEE